MLSQAAPIEWIGNGSQVMPCQLSLSVAKVCTDRGHKQLAFVEPAA